MFYDFVFFQFFCLEPNKPKVCKGRRLIFIEHLHCPVRHFVHISSFKSHNSRGRVGLLPRFMCGNTRNLLRSHSRLDEDVGGRAHATLWSCTRLADVGASAAFYFTPFQDKVKYKSVYIKIQHFMKEKRLSGLDINEDTHRPRHHC